MKRKIAALILTVFLLSGLLSGCGAADTKDTAAKSQTNANAGAETAENEESGAAEHIIVTYVTLGQTPADISKVQSAINEISVSEINVEVELKPIAISETYTSYSTWIASGEQLDLMMLTFQDPASYVSSGSILALDEYLESYAPDIKKLADEFPISAGATINNAIYGINPVEACYGSTGAIMLRKDYFDELGIQQKDKYSYEELDEIFAAVKANHPESYPLGVMGSDASTSNSLYSRFKEVDVLGAGVDSGALLTTDSTEVVNLFETEEYYEYLQWMKQWYDAGYIMKDAATTTSTMQELTLAGTIASTLVFPYSPQVQQDYNNGFSNYGGAVALKTTDVYFPSSSASTGTYWTVPVTSANPEAAVKFLNLTYSNLDLLNLLQWGLEGEHYVFSDETNHVITFPEGVEANKSGYYNSLGLWGDKREIYVWSEVNSKEINEKMTEAGMKNQTVSKQHSYAYNKENMVNQLIAVDTVLQQYLPALETGSVSNLETTYAEFIAALKAAGMDDIIADNQAQFDAVIAK